MNKIYSATVFAGSSVFHHVDLTNVNYTNYLNVRINSPENNCGTVSIHPMKCPLPESNEDNNVENSVFNYWQNMYRTGALNLNTNVYKKNNGFFIKFTSYASNCKCDP